MRFALSLCVVAMLAVVGAVLPRDAAKPASAATAELADTRVRYPSGNYPRLSMPDGEPREVRSLLDVRQRLRFGSYVWDEKDIPAGPVWVRVDLANQTLSVFRAGHEIGTTVILYGADRKPTPPGVYPVLQRAQHHRSSIYDAEMPYMLRLTPDGIAIHASDVRAAAATHGCIGVPISFARLLFAQVRRGDIVAIIGAAPPSDPMKGGRAT